MKESSITHLAVWVLLIVFLLSFTALQPLGAQTPDSGYAEPSGKYSREELTQMLAPIALYPDALLSQVLMASTYPIEVIEADRWVRKNHELKDEALDYALLSMNWDTSVKALCHFPPVLALMSERIAETTSIGNAFLVQEGEVMDMIQELRVRAYARGNLSTGNEQKVIVEKETIVIAPADPRVIYVPYYDPYYVYGTWWYPAYPPYFWRPAMLTIGTGISYWPGFYFGVAFGNWSYLDWHYHYIYIDINKRPKYARRDLLRSEHGRWKHAPRHRRGVAYRDESTARKFGQDAGLFREFTRDDRGYAERRDQEQRINKQIRIDRNRLEDNRPVIHRRQKKRARIVPDGREQQRVASPRQIHIRTVPDRQETRRVVPPRQIRARTEPDRMEQQRVISPRQIHIRTVPDRQETRRVISPRQIRKRSVTDRKETRRSVSPEQLRASTDTDRRKTHYVDRDIQKQERVERRHQERGHYNRGRVRR
jgi:hypothetical protein